MEVSKLAGVDVSKLADGRSIRIVMELQQYWLNRQKNISNSVPEELRKGFDAIFQDDVDEANRIIADCKAELAKRNLSE